MLQCREWQHLTKAFCGDQHFEALLSLSVSCEAVKVIDAHTLAITHVGVIVLSTGLVVQVLPKVAIAPTPDEEIQALIRMLGCIHNIKPKPSNAQGFWGIQGRLYEWLVEAFLHEVECIVRQGMKRDYIQTSANLDFVRGKIVFGEDIKHNSALRHRTFVAHEAYRADILQNQLIKEALRRCVRFGSSVGKGDCALARRLAHYFDGICSIDCSSANVDHLLGLWTLDRYFGHYNTVKPLVEMILKGISFFEIDGYNYEVFLLDMPSLFEAYVGCKLGAKPHTLHLDQAEQFRLEPDFVWREEDRRKVADAKWKAYGGVGDIERCDRYQAFAYAARYGSDVILIYPKDFSHDQVEAVVHFEALPSYGIQVHLWDLCDDGHKL